LERITFCSACGCETAYGLSSCEMCGAPLKQSRFDWRAKLRSIPRPTPLGILIACAVIAIAVAVYTALAG